METQTQHKARRISAISLCAVLVIGLFPASAGAVTAAEKQAEADSLVAQVDTLQTQLNEANASYNQAEADHEAALAAMDDAQQRIDYSAARITELQGTLSERSVSMYKNGGNTSFLDVILGASSFEQFLTTLDAFTAITNQDAAMIQESKDLRTEAQQAHEEYAAQEKVAADSMKVAAESQAQISASTQALQTQIASITEEARQLAAEEAAAAEKAAHEAELAHQAEIAAAEAAAASSGQSSGSGGVATEATVAGQDYTAGGSSLSGSGVLNNPLPGASISSGFGARWGTVHKGIDLPAAEGTPYYAAESGTVLYATNGGGYNGGAGNWVVIAHGNGMVTKYMHSSVTYVTPGQQVSRGQNIGAVGNTGDSYGAHLHFQLEINGVAVDPTSYL